MTLFSWFGNNRKVNTAQQEAPVQTSDIGCHNSNMWPIAKVRSAVIVASIHTVKKSSTSMPINLPLIKST